MRVQAIAEGYYNGLQKVGAIFELEERRNEDDEIITPETQFSKKWMIALDKDGNPVKNTPPEKAALAKQAEEPSKNLAEKSTPSKNDNGTDIEVLKDRLEQADKADDKGLADGKDGEILEASKEPAPRRSRKVEDTAAKAEETKEAAKDAGEAAKEAADADDKGDDKGSADDADAADKAPAEDGSRRRRRRG